MINPAQHWKLDDDWLADLELPKPWLKVEYRTLESELKKKNAALKEENERLQKELAEAHSRGRSLARSCSEAAQEIGRLRAENEQLKQELAEARELSLF